VSDIDEMIAQEEARKRREREAAMEAQRNAPVEAQRLTNKANLYEQSDQYDAQSVTAWTSMMTDYDALLSRLKADTNRARETLNDAKRN